MTTTFEFDTAPSHSKGWARIKAASDGKPVIQSRTDNEWVSAGKEADLTEGQLITLTIQEQVNVGKGRTARKELHEGVINLIADASSDLKLRCGEFTRIIVTGARLAQ